MHDVIGMLPVSTDIGLKMNCVISADISRYNNLLKTNKRPEQDMRDMMVVGCYKQMWHVEVESFVLFCTRNKSNMILGFAFYACMCWRPNTIILYVNFPI